MNSGFFNGRQTRQRSGQVEAGPAFRLAVSLKLPVPMSFGSRKLSFRLERSKPKKLE